MHNEFFLTKKLNHEIKIAVISDIHYYPNFNNNILKKITEQIKKNKPDYICIVGDILDESKFTQLDKLINFLNEITKISPTIVVLGNHDEKSGSFLNWEENNNPTLSNALKNIPNLHLLSDSIWQDQNITFYGFNLSFNYYEKSKESYEIFVQETNKLKCNIPQNTYNITLFHSPVNIYRFIEENKNHNLNNSDLILSGHMHNGCFPFFISYPINKIFKTNIGLISPQKKPFPKLAQGKVTKIKNGYIYEGVTKLSHSTKLFHCFDFLFQKKVEFLTIKPNKNSK